ncbi:hypothetical protein GCM10009839_23430 [Catenulispora yoronensis]|uniref:Uncharacterized protein n=1 Tax=Catenulispora yoronensis TaxID=450799 RepID=A0ABN2TZE1_9ACTN
MYVCGLLPSAFCTITPRFDEVRMRPSEPDSVALAGDTWRATRLPAVATTVARAERADMAEEVIRRERTMAKPPYSERRREPSACPALIAADRVVLYLRDLCVNRSSECVARRPSKAV